MPTSVKDPNSVRTICSDGTILNLLCSTNFHLTLPCGLLLDDRHLRSCMRQLNDFEPCEFESWERLLISCIEFLLQHPLYLPTPGDHALMSTTAPSSARLEATTRRVRLTDLTSCRSTTLSSKENCTSAQAFPLPASEQASCLTSFSSSAMHQEVP